MNEARSVRHGSPRPWRLVAGCTVWLGLLTLPSAAGTPVARAQSDPAPADTVQQFGGTVGAVGAEGDRVCAGIGPRLVMIDATLPDSLVERWRSKPLAAAVSACAIHGRQVVVMSGRDVIAYDVDSGALLGALALSAPGGSMATDGGMMVLRDKHQLLVVSMGGPMAVEETARIDLPASGALALSQGRVAVATDDDVQLVSLEDPKRPQLRGKVALADVRGLAWADHVLLAVTGSQLAAFDASSLDQPAAGGASRLGVTNPWAVLATDMGIFTVSRWRLEGFDRGALPALGPGPAHGLALDASAIGAVAMGSRLLVATWAGLQVVDAADLRGPDLLADLPDAGTYVDLATISGQRLLALGREPGRLVVMDLTQPTAPVPLGEVALPGSPWKLRSAGTLAFVMAADAGLLTVDLTDPKAPRLLATLPMPSQPWDLALMGQTVLVACDADGLQVVDVRDPSAPRIVATVPGVVRGLAVADGKGLLVGEGLRIFDLAKPAEPRLLGSLASGDGDVVLPAAAPGLAYVGGTDLDGNDVLQVVDWHDAGAPTLSRSVSLGYAAHALELGGGFLWIPSGRFMELWSVGDAADPAWRWRVPVDVNVNGLALSDDGTQAYAAHAFGGIGVFNASVKALGVTQRPLSAAGLTQQAVPVSGGVLAIQSSGCCSVNRLQALRAGADGSLSPAGQTEATYGLAYVAADDHLVALLTADPAEDTAVVTLFDGTNPLALKALGRLELDSYWNWVAIDGDTLLLGTRRALLAVDCSNPAQPVAANSLSLDADAQSMVVMGRQAYFAGNEALQVVDLLDPLAPSLRGTLLVPGKAEARNLEGLAVAGERAYLSYTARGEALDEDSSGGLAVVDVSDQDQPGLMGWYTRRDVRGVAAEGDQVLAWIGVDLRQLQRTKPGSLLGLVSTDGLAYGTPALRHGRFAAAAGSAGLFSNTAAAASFAGRVYLPAIRAR